MPVFDAMTGKERRAHVFVAVLGASNYTYAEARWREGLADWIGAHVNALRDRRRAEGDRLRQSQGRGHDSLPLRARHQPDLPGSRRPTTALPILPTRPRKPRDKAKVEVAVQIVERFVLARLRNRRFFSLAELNVAIRVTGRRTQRQGHAQARRQPPRALRRASIGRR